MSVRGLVKYLSSLEKPPVYLNQIRDWIIEKGFVNDIQFRPSKKFHKLGGGIIESVWVPNPVPYAEPNLVSNIYFNDNLPSPMIKFVCCKEMLHLFDSDIDRTATREEVDSLVADLTSKATFRELLAKVGTELVNEYLALVVLVPLHLFAPLEEEFRNGKIDEAKIASEFEIPESAVRDLFDEKFRLIAERILT